MCGFAGFLGGAPFNGEFEYKAVLERMGETIAHRGPDDHGAWFDPAHRIGLSHRRLAIVDVSSAGRQPMQSHSGRYVIAFNGEIYNHLSLRKSLEDESRIAAWKGHSDTETLLAAFDAWGVAGTVDRAIGMFAFALWDRKEGVLTLGRDRLGEKPLYYGWQGQGRNAVFLFGSELKSLRVHPAFGAQVDRAALCAQLRHSYVPSPYSIYQGISKLAPGSLLTVSMTQRDPVIASYWSGAKVAQAGASTVFDGTAEEAVDALEMLLKDAVLQQMVADVPLGAFLSGGVDSSTVVALMQAQSVRPVKTFSIGFHEDGYDEAQHARAVAKHLGTDHTELYVTAEDAMTVIPRLPGLYDEPFADSSQIPTFLVAQLAKRHVTVSLSGDAGDELFCGYGRYMRTNNLWRALAALPSSLRAVASRALRAVPVHSWNSAAGLIRNALPPAMRKINVGDKLHKGAGLLSSESIDALYFRINSHWENPASVVVGGVEAQGLIDARIREAGELDGIQRMMAIDMLTYLPDDILVKVDRAAMGVSLETRVPFLDHRVVEFAWRLPQSMKLRDGQTKWALRQVLYRHVPRELIERPKMGFGVPIAKWLRGPLRDWAEALLDASRLRNEGFFDAAQVRGKWEEHVSGERNWQYLLWDVLMFQAWLEHR